MPKCSRCPVKAECNQNPIRVTKDDGGESIRVCPLVVAVRFFSSMRPVKEEKKEAGG